MKLLTKLIKKLQKLTRVFYLYSYSCSQKNKPDIIRLKKHIEEINKVIIEIEKKMGE